MMADLFILLLLSLMTLSLAAGTKYQFNIFKADSFTAAKLEEIIQNNKLSYPIAKSKLRFVVANLLNHTVDRVEDPPIILEDKKLLYLKIAKEFAQSLYEADVNAFHFNS